MNSQISDDDSIQSPIPDMPRKGARCRPVRTGAGPNLQVIHHLSGSGWIRIIRKPDNSWCHSHDTQIYDECWDCCLHDLPIFPLKLVVKRVECFRLQLGTVTCLKAPWQLHPASLRQWSPEADISAPKKWQALWLSDGYFVVCLY